MYLNNLKKLRQDSELTQNDIAKAFNINRNTYKNWENGFVMIPLEYADKFSLYYKVRLSYILGIDKNFNYNPKIKKMNYDKMIKTLNDLKKSRKVSYDTLSSNIECAKSSCYSYFKRQTIIPIDRLILLAEFFDIDLDKLCGKE